MTTKPQINVTPLIDVLLVLLIIFMVISPLKPTDFKTQVPSQPNDRDNTAENERTLVVALAIDSTLRLNRETNIGTVNDPSALIERLSEIFAARTENGVYSTALVERTDLRNDEKIEKTVFIKAPRSLDYGSVAKVIDAVKQSGAKPISLQIDDLD